MVAAVTGGFTTWASLPAPLRGQASAKFGAAKQDMVNKFIAKRVGKNLVNKLAKRIAAQAVQTAVYKTLAKKLGVSAGLSSTGVGIPVSMLSTMGIIEKASAGAARLRAKYPAVYARLEVKDMHMAWFLIEPYVPEIVLEVGQAMADMIARTTPDGRVLVNAGGSNDRVPIASGGSGTRVPIASGGSSPRRVPIASGGGPTP
ncbi:MAG: hypothetical protein KY454_02005 [Actinobacteria bacterium]|nr:hypothetical protein [Actinomycetota bacterium]